MNFCVLISMGRGKETSTDWILSRLLTLIHLHLKMLDKINTYLLANICCSARNHGIPPLHTCWVRGGSYKRKVDGLLTGVPNLDYQQKDYFFVHLIMSFRTALYCQFKLFYLIISVSYTHLTLPTTPYV